jgi:hypothetical protein
MKLGGISAGQLVNAARSSAGGVPRLFRAARAAGANTAEASSMLAASGAALAIAMRRSGRVPGRQNAVRHFIWQAYLVGKYGEDVASAVGEAQESRSTDARDSAVDQENNAVALEYARDHAEELRAGPMHSTLERLADVALAKWDAGELARVRPQRP